MSLHTMSVIFFGESLFRAAVAAEAQPTPL